MRTSCLISLLALLLFLVSLFCEAKQAYMWTDEHGIPHISDQPPPQGVDAVSVPAEREFQDEKNGLPEKQQKEEVPAPPSISQKDGAKPAVLRSPDKAPAELPRPPQYRDLSTLTRSERMELMILEAEKERAERLLESASDEEEHNHWKKEIDQMKAREREILRSR